LLGLILCIWFGGPEREGGEGGGYNENGGAEPYQEHETLSILYLTAQSIIRKLNEL